MFIGMMLETLSLGLIIPAISLVTQQDIYIDNPQVQPILIMLGTPTENELVIIGMLFLAFIYLLKTVFLVYLLWKQNHYSYSLLAQLSEKLYLGYLAMPWSFHINNNSAYLLRNITTEVSVVINSVLMPILRLTSEILVLTGIAILLFIVEPVGAISVFLIGGMAGFLFQKLTKKHILQWGEERQLHEGRRILHLQQGLKSVKEIQLLGRELEFFDLYSPENIKGINAIRNKVTLQQLPRLFFEFLAILGLTVLVVVQVLQEKSLNSILPIVGLFTAASFRLLPSVNKIIEAVQSLHFGSPALKVIKKQLSILKGDAHKSHKNKAKFENEIVMNNIYFSYPESDDKVINGISIKIKKGSSIGIIGKSGAGKSTLVDILLGLLTPSKGEILVDGLDINKDLRAWKNLIGYVPQHISLLDDTLLNNITFGLSDFEIDIKSVNRAIKAAHLEPFIKTLPEGLETIIGESGVKLSGGQRQRIGVARALYHDPSILVLDEATSALDSETEHKVMDSIYSLSKEKTVIIIAHRISTLEKCDTLYSVAEGKVIQEK
jgi:ATP-binding cassette, subfamily B, bacterial PglK